MQPDREELLKRVSEAVRQAGELFGHHEMAEQIRQKGETDFVTQVDVEVQELVRGRLRSMYPDIQFMGEEKDNGEIDFSRPVWILDPVDGTTNLIHDFRASTLSLALWQDGDIRMGLVYQPYTEELFTAVRGREPS